MAASALYACTKCTQRYPFEELSQGQQLCKVRGRWAAGGRGFLGGSPSDLGARCIAAPLFSPAPGIWSPRLLTQRPGYPRTWASAGKTPERTESYPLPGGPEGAVRQQC